VTGHVVAVGGVNLDTLARVTGDRTDAGTSNPGRTTRTAGGVARNVAENLARLGTPVRLVAVVGRDPVGEDLLAGLATAGVDVSAVLRSDLPTGSYTAVLDHRGDLVAGVADMAAAESLSPGELAADTFAGAAWAVVDGNLVPETVRHCLALAADADVPVVLDPVGVAKASRLPLRCAVHTFTPNRDELAAFAGTHDLHDGVAVTHRRGVHTIWLREGPQGSTLFRTGHAPVPVRLPPAEVVDVTGAGDAMLAGYLHRMVDGSDAVEAARFGAAAAWLTVRSPYSVCPGLTHDLVEQTLDRLQGSTP
jgi:pseudouridine kinase